MELANIQSRSLEMIDASQRNQQEAFQELTRASRDKANDSMFTAIKFFDEQTDRLSRTGLTKSTKLAEPATEVSGPNSAGAVRQVILSCDEFTDAELVTKLRSCFSHAPTMNEAREELRNMRQMEHESISVYMYRWGRALYRSSGTQPSEERHPHVIRDFISSLKKNIRKKIANRWAEMWHPPNTIERVFELASNVEKQLHIVDSFKLDFPTYPSNELNEMSKEETSGDDQELNEMSRGKKWGGNTNNYNHKHSSFSNNCGNSYKQQQNQPQENRQAKQWTQQPKDSKITLTQESDHYVPTEFSGNFFKQFDLAMKLKCEELKRQGRSSNHVNELTENNLIQTFSVNEDQMDRAALMLNRSENTEKSGNLLA